MSSNKRILWIDVVKYACIIFVMASHLESGTDFLRAFYTPIFLKAFFFASGYTYRFKKGFGLFIYKKTRQLFVPWLIFSLFNIFLSQILSFNEHSGLLSELKWNFLQIRGCGDGMWFVAALFVAYIPFYFFIDLYTTSNRKHKSWTALIVAFLLSLGSVLFTKLISPDVFPWNQAALPWHLEYIFQAMFYMFLGYLFREKYEFNFDKFDISGKKFFLLAVYLFLIYVPYGLKLEMPMVLDVSLAYLCSILGIAMVVAFSKAVRPNRYINYVGQNTLIYFALHGKLLSFVEYILNKFFGNIYSVVLQNTAISSAFSLCFSLVISVVLILPAYIINCWFPWILGREKNR